VALGCVPCASIAAGQAVSSAKHRAATRRATARRSRRKRKFRMHIANVESARCMLVNLGIIGSMTVHSVIVTVQPR
jgi:hypothetical protein